MLRAFRYARWTGDSTFLASIAGNLKGAAAWLGSRDADGDALPDAGSYWCDWKDVKGLADRKVSPHASFLYLAALHDLLDATKTGRDGAQQAAELENRYLRAKAAVDARVESGGLWNGRFYVERWKDGKTAPQVNEDQIVGSLFGEMPVERAMLVFDSLLPNRRPWGCARASLPPHLLRIPPRRLRQRRRVALAQLRGRVGAPQGGSHRRRARDPPRLLAPGRIVGIRHSPTNASTARPAARCATRRRLGTRASSARSSTDCWESSGSRAAKLQVAPRAIAGPGWRVRVPVAEGEVEVAAGAAGEPPRFVGFWRGRSPCASPCRPSARSRARSRRGPVRSRSSDS